MKHELELYLLILARNEQNSYSTAKYSRNKIIWSSACAGYNGGIGEGVDISLRRGNLKFTPTERIEKMRRALAFVMEVRRAGEAAANRPKDQAHLMELGALKRLLQEEG